MLGVRIGWLLAALGLSACSLIVGGDDPAELELESLAINPGGLDQVFKPETRNYTATLSYVSQIEVVPRLNDPDARIEVTSAVFPDAQVQPVPSGTAHNIPVLAGENQLTIRLTTPQDVTTTYTVTVTVPGARFATPQTTPVMGNPVAVKTADFTRDGTPDIVACSSIGVFLFDGDGQPIGGNVGIAPCLDMSIGDVDGVDGPDLVVVTNTNVVSVNRNLGNGGFHPVDAIFGAGGSSFHAVAFGSIDGDGTLDVVIGDNNNGKPADGRVRWALGNGDGTFGAIQGDVPIGKNPVSLLLGNFDTDPSTDALVLDGDAGAITLVQGNGAGAFARTKLDQTETSPETLDTPARSLIRINADADPVGDYAVVHGDRDELAVIRNFAGGDTVFANLVHDIFPTEAGPTSVTAADLDRDGNEDLIVTCRNAGVGKVILFYGDGSGGYSPVGFDSPSPIGTAVADFNGDELLDLVILGQDSTAVLQVLLQEAL